MAGAEEIVAALPERDDVTYIGLVLNERGFDRAAAAGLKEINVVAVATDTFAQRNQGCTSDESVEAFQAISPRAVEAGIRPTVTLSASFGCPYEGEVPVDRVVDICRRLGEAGATEVALADSIGVAAPSDVTERIAAVREVLPSSSALRAHFHNTRNTGLGQRLRRVRSRGRRARRFARRHRWLPVRSRRATGNIPTEDLVYMLERMGVDTGVDLDRLASVVPWIEDVLGKRVPGLFAKAGPFPRSA